MPDVENRDRETRRTRPTSYLATHFPPPAECPCRLQAVRICSPISRQHACMSVLSNGQPPSPAWMPLDRLDYQRGCRHRQAHKVCRALLAGVEATLSTGFSRLNDPALAHYRRATSQQTKMRQWRRTRARKRRRTKETPVQHWMSCRPPKSFCNRCAAGYTCDGALR